MSLRVLNRLHDATASTRPDAEAVICRNTVIDYAGLVARANQLARVLRSCGVEKGQRVGIYMPKSIESVVSVHGILRAGAAYVPIDPSAPEERIRFILRDCGIRVLVSKPEKRRVLNALCADLPRPDVIIGLEQADADGTECIPWQDVYGAGTETPDVNVSETDLAYIMYTSGSTGVPKGLAHTHASGYSFARLAASTYMVGPQSRLANHAPLHFDLSTFDLFAGPLAGAAAVILPEELMFFPEALARSIGQYRPTHWYSIPLALIQMLESGALSTTDCSSLQWVMFAGEVFPPSPLARLMHLLPHARFSNLYGPAETNVCTVYHLPEMPADETDPVPIGKTWAETQHLILNELEHPAEPGQAGELLIASSTMMKGYWNRPDLDESAFAVLPGRDGKPARFYRTGDLVVEQRDGNLEFLGRKDRQVKIRGVRIELDEIEAVLNAHPSVIEAAVIAPRLNETERLLTAVISIRGESAASTDDLRRYLAGKLASSHIPGKIEVMPSLPHTGSGKIDRKRLERSYSGRDQAPLRRDR